MGSSSILKLYLALLMLSCGSCANFHTSTSRALTDRSSQNSYSGNSQESSTSSGGTQEQAGPSQAYQIGRFDWPVDNARLTRGFLPKKRKPHLGIDLASPKGTPVLAAQRGTVIYTGRDFHGFGKMVLIESGYGWATLYAHFDKIYVSEGQKVGMGEILGAMGRSGHATGVHLHFEIRKDKGPVDPLPLLPDGEKISRLIGQN